MLSKHFIQILGLGATMLGMVATGITTWVGEKKTEALVEEKVAEALARQQKENQIKTEQEEES